MRTLEWMLVLALGAGGAGRDAHVPSVGERDDRLVAGPVDSNVDIAAPDTKTSRLEASEAVRQERIERDRGSVGRDLEPEDGADAQERARGGPRLRAAGDRIRERRRGGGARFAAEELRETMVREALRGVDERGDRRRRGLAGPVAGHARGGDRGVVRPDAAVVVAQRIEVRRAGAPRADAPAAHEIRRLKPPRRPRAVLERCDARPEHMTGIRGDVLDTP